tara:strand:+ start:2089 stop:2982 length:894 start_codon:yes stop_codon:yes gene_type:complete
VFSCKQIDSTTIEKSVGITVLGTVQDGGVPHLGCIKSCCKKYFEQGFSKKRVVSLGLYDHKKKKNYLIEASPDISIQLNDFLSNNSKKLDGIFITHAHIGHYSGLINLGREVFNASKIPLYLMPKMTDFISSNGPWDQLVKLKNVELKSLSNEKEEKLTENLTIVPFKVPHRDEYSETVGFKIIGPNKTALFIPDIDKWSKWKISIKKLISKVDYAFLDGTFYDSKEINNRDISEIPHPFIIESLKLFKDLKESDRNKIYFIHLNHTNPLLNSKSEEYQHVVSNGYNVALEGLKLEL